MEPFRFFYFFIIMVLLSACNTGSRKQNSSQLNAGFPESYIPLLDSSVMENSGIIYWNKFIWTFNDSGGKNEVYGMDAKTGEVKITLRLTNATNTDWEDIAQSGVYLFIAETGNNSGVLQDLKIYRFKKKQITNNPFQSVSVDSILFNFADQTDFTPSFRKTKWDCEALLFYNDSLYVFTKDWVNFITKVYVMPNIPGTYILNPIDSFDVKGLITGADINAKGKIALVGYQNYKSFVWLFQKTDSTLFANPKWIDLSMLENAQTEGICFNPRGDLLMSCEQTVNYLQQIWKIRKEQFR